MMKIPSSKVSRTIAMIEYLVYGCDSKCSKLGVSMVTRFLQSLLVPATSGMVGASFLQPIYDNLHCLPCDISPSIQK